MVTRVAVIGLLGLGLQGNAVDADSCSIRTLEAFQFAGGPYVGRPDPPGRQQWRLRLASPSLGIVDLDMGRKSYEVHIEPTHFSEIEAALEAAGFLKWPTELGSIYVTPDPARRDLSVTCNDGRSRTTSFYDIASSDLLAQQGASGEFIQQSRAFVKFWILIRSLFSDSDAVDTRPGDREFLEAAQQGVGADERRPNDDGGAVRSSTPVLGGPVKRRA
jgi:hypothetical protein